jgi:hypothetical protein
MRDMAILAPSHSITTDRDHNEVHFAIGGFWTAEAMRRFLFDLGEAAKPFMRAHVPFSAIGDLRDFVPQDRETADMIRDSLASGRSNGLSRFAIVTTSAMVKLQYRRITLGLEIEFFDEPDAARRWLRVR